MISISDINDFTSNQIIIIIIWYDSEIHLILCKSYQVSVNCKCVNVNVNISDLNFNL